MNRRPFICPPMPAEQVASARRAGRLDFRVGEMVVTREWYYDHLAYHNAETGRESSWTSNDI